MTSTNSPRTLQQSMRIHTHTHTYIALERPIIFPQGSPHRSRLLPHRMSASRMRRVGAPPRVHEKLIPEVIDQHEQRHEAFSDRITSRICRQVHIPMPSADRRSSTLTVPGVARANIPGGNVRYLPVLKNSWSLAAGSLAVLDGCFKLASALGKQSFREQTHRKTVAERYVSHK